MFVFVDELKVYIRIHVHVFFAASY